MVVYGLNNTGKTNLLRAVSLFSRLVAQPLTKLLEETGENPAGLYERLGEDRWMFAHGGGGRVVLEAALEPGALMIGFEVRLDGNVVCARLTEWADGDRDYLALATEARRALQVIQQTDSADSRAAETFDFIKRHWSVIRSSVCVAQTNQFLPITPELRQTVAAHSRASDIVQRKRVTRMRKIFSDVVMGLPAGALEEVEENDFGWVMDDGIVPLDFLGSGAQAVFGILASIATSDAPILLVDEPESHLRRRGGHEHRRGDRVCRNPGARCRPWR